MKVFQISDTVLINVNNIKEVVQKNKTVFIYTKDKTVYEKEVEKHFINLITFIRKNTFEI